MILTTRQKRQLHHPKTENKVSTTKQKRQLDPLNLTLNVNGSQIEQVRNHKVLGVTIDDNLLWPDHISKICKKVSRNLYLLKKLKMYVSSDHRKQFFFAHCMSHINYASTIWSEAAENHMKNLNSLHRRGAKLICDDIDIPTELMPN